MALLVSGFISSLETFVMSVVRRRTCNLLLSSGPRGTLVSHEFCEKIGLLATSARSLRNLKELDNIYEGGHDCSLFVQLHKMQPSGKN